MSIDKVSTAANVCTYAASCVPGGYGIYRLVNSMTPDQWAAVGVIGSLSFAALTYVTNVAIKVWAIKHNYRLPDDEE